MNNRFSKMLLAAAVLYAVSGAANAALVNLIYSGIIAGSPAGPPSVGLISGSGTWTWDTVTNDIVQTGSNSNSFYAGPPIPPQLVYQQNLTNLVISGAGVASASAYSCVNGAFAASPTGLNRDVCAAYNYGTNQTNESTVSLDGTAVTLLGGDDFLSGAPQTLSNNFDMSVRTLVGNTLTVNKTSWSPTVPGNFQMTFTVVPIPAAGWLLGTGLGMISMIRRRKTVA